MDSYTVISTIVREYLLHCSIKEEDLEDYLKYASRLGFVCYYLDDKLETARLDQVLLLGSKVASFQQMWTGSDRDEICVIKTSNKLYRNYTNTGTLLLPCYVADFIKSKDKNASNVTVFYDFMTTNNLFRASKMCSILMDVAEPLGLLAEAEELISSCIRERILKDIERITPNTIELSPDAQGFSETLRLMEWKLQGGERKDEAGYEAWKDVRYVEPQHLYSKFSLDLLGIDTDSMSYTDCLKKAKEMIAAL